MSKSDNLHDFLVDIAEAVREKKGTTEMINPQNFSEEIKNLPSGSTEVEEKDINFYDYDGTLLFSYTIPEAQALTELPTPKGHSGLIFDGWNWDYEEVIALDYPMNIGAMYRTDDGATRLYIDVTFPMEVPIYFSQSISSGVVVDWGDGSPSESVEGTTDVTLSHNYDKGSYCVSLLPTNGCTLHIGASSNNTNVFGLFYYVYNFGKFGLKKVHLGVRVKCRQKCFSDCYNLRYFTFSSDTRLESNMLYGNSLLECLILPSLSNTTCNAVGNLFQICRKVCMPEALYNGYTRDVLYSGMAAGRYLTEIKLPDSIKTIETNACRETNLTYIRMPRKLEAIRQYSMDGLYCLKVWDFRACEKVPTNALTNKGNIQSDCKVVVPDSLYDEWIAATNWAAMADQIIKASEYISTKQLNNYDSKRVL